MKYCFIILVLLGIVFLNSHFNIIAFSINNTSNEGLFRVMTYNANGISGDYNDDRFVEDFLSTIDSIHPQVLVLQEMRKVYSDLLCRELQDRYPYNSLVELSKRRLYSVNVACLFSSFPIIDFSRMKYNRQEIDSVYVRYSIPDSLRYYVNSELYHALLDINGNEIQLVCCYLKTNEYSRLRKNYSGRWIDGLNDYFKGYKLGRAFRCLDAKMIRDTIAKYNLPTIVCGDMNDFQFSSPVKTIMGDDLKNVWWERGMGYGMTYDKYHLKLRIDHVLFSKEFEPVNVDVPHLRFSDHYPIVADMKLR